MLSSNVLNESTKDIEMPIDSLKYVDGGGNFVVVVD